MYLFNFVLEQWVLSALYVLLTARVVFRFRRQIVMESRWYRKMHYHLVRRWEAQQLQWIGVVVLLVLVLLPVTLLLFPVAPILWIILGHLDTKEQERRDGEDRRYRERKQAELERKQHENARRAKARERWLAKNKLKLYYNTVSGVTAVLRPADYADIQKRTECSRSNGFWKKDNVLLPVRDTFVFVTKQGREMIDANTGSDYVSRYKVAGWISQLDDVIRSGGVELVRVEDIFVPWVNETLLLFSEQAKMLNDCVHTSRYHLVDMQAPRKLQPLDY